MSTSLSPLHIRRRLGREDWRSPDEFGPDGWSFINTRLRLSLIVSVADHADGIDWIHASMAGAAWLPGYEEMVLMHRAVWNGQGYAYEVFAPDDKHVNIHPYARHLWGRLDGKPVLPEFAGSIPGFERSI